MKTTLGTRAWACVKKGRIKVDTVCVDSESANFLCNGALREQGFSVRRVRVVLERPGRAVK